MNLMFKMKFCVIGLKSLILIPGHLTKCQNLTCGNIKHIPAKTMKYVFKTVSDGEFSLLTVPSLIEMRENVESGRMSRHWKRTKRVNGDSEQIYVLNYILVPFFLSLCNTFFLLLYCIH
jgi:hypothetical protein